MVVNLLDKKCGCGDTKDRRAFRLNAVVEYDPTRTLTLRNRFVRDMEKRFNWVKKQVREKLVTDNFLAPDIDIRRIFGLVENTEYPHKDSKIKAFNRWLEGMLEQGLLESTVRGFASPTGWSDPYIEKAYNQGVKRARQEMTAVGKGGRAGFGSAHANELEAMKTRTFDEIRGVSRAVQQSMSRTLAQGMAEGRSPREIAKRINEASVDKLGVVRGRTIARTETIRAHHIANIEEYQQAGVEGVAIKAEWVTAGTRVCQICQALEGTIWKLEEIKGAIPAHPQCRCVAVPVVQAPRRRRGQPRARYDRTKRPQNVKGVAGHLPPCVINADGLEINVSRKCASKKDMEKVKRARDSYVKADKSMQDLGKHNEYRIARFLRGIQQPNKKPYDVHLGNKHLIEVKTLIKTTKDRVHMRGDSRGNKERFFARWKRKFKGAKNHVVAIDTRGGKIQIYHREGVGAFRFNTMEKVTPKRLAEIMGVKNPGRLGNLRVLDPKIVGDFEGALKSRVGVVKPKRKPKAKPKAKKVLKTPKPKTVKIPKTIIPIDKIDDVSEAFETHIAKSINENIPKHVQTKLKKEGVRVKIGSRQSIINPEMKGVGSGQGATWDSIGGAFSPHNNVIQIPELFMLRAEGISYGMKKYTSIQSDMNLVML